MPNKDLEQRLFNTGDNGKKENFNSLTTQQSRLRKAKQVGEETQDYSEFQRLGGEAELNRLSGVIDLATQANYNIKDARRNGGGENVFKKKHTKDRDNANPTAVGGLPDVTKGNMKDKIMNNQEVYNESKLTEEINGIKYLIKYLSKEII